MLIVLGALFSALTAGVYLLEEPAPVVEVEHGSTAPAQIRVNEAGVAELSALPGIGPKKAEKIIEARKAAPIVSIEELAAAAGGISQANLEKMKKYVSFE